MAMNSAEQGIVDSLQSQVDLFRANLDYFVPDIYADESEEAQNEILTWWNNPSNMIVIQVGYNNSPVQGLSWNVTIGAEKEIEPHQLIGSLGSLVGAVETDASYFDTAYIIGILGPNGNWLRWSQMLCKWSLLYQRQALEANYGIQHQRISMGPLQPAPDDLKDAVKFLFMRTVTLTAEHVDTWSLLPFQTVTDATVTLIPTS